MYGEKSASGAVGLNPASQEDAFLKAVIATTPECIKVVAADGRLLRMNGAGLEMIGAETEESVHGLCVFDLVAEEHRAQWQAQHARVCAGERLSWEFDIVGLNGERRHMETHAAPLTLPTGETGQLAITRDITSRKQQADALAESERRHRQVLEALPAAIYTIDAQGKLTFFNRAAAVFAGREPQLGTDSWCVTSRLTWPDGAPLAHEDCPMALAMREGRAILGEVEALAEQPGGGSKPFMPFATPLYDGKGVIVGGVNMLVDTSERKRADARQRVLMDELNHRVKNTLATVQSIAIQTMKGADSLEGFRAAFDERLVALSRAYDLLTGRQWEGADLQSLLEGVFATLAPGRGELAGPAVTLPPPAVLLLGMVFHELATNAVKHGALSQPEGQVAVSWGKDGDALVLTWAECGGPAVSAPKRRGFGMRLLERGVTRDLGGRTDLDYALEGLRCRVQIPLAGLAA